MCRRTKAACGQIKAVPDMAGGTFFSATDHLDTLVDHLLIHVDGNESALVEVDV